MDNQLRLFIETVFLNLIDIGISASYLIAAVLAARFFLRRAPKSIRIILWILVGIRLACPFSVESDFSLMPEREHVDISVMHTPQAYIDTGIPAINQTIGQYLQQGQSAATGGTDAAGVSAVSVCAMVWLVVFLSMCGYFLFSWWNLKRKVCDAVPEEIQINSSRVKIYRSSRIAFPFLFGLFRPKIYLPFTVSDEEAAYVAAHELAHKSRKDYLGKPIGYLLLACYWFHPLVWVSYILMCRDIELACDEKVIRDLGVGHIKEYSQALLACSIDKTYDAACLVAFGEIGVKERVKNILNYKKPAFWMTVIAVAACVAVGVCFMTQKTGSVQYRDEAVTYDAEGTSYGKENNIAQGTFIDQAAPDEDAARGTAEVVVEDTARESSIPEFIDDHEAAYADASIQAFFRNPHDEPEYLYMEADLDGDGSGEKIVLTDLHYNGGDGGYKLEVFRMENGKETLIPLPSGQANGAGNEDEGFAFPITYTNTQVSLGLPSGMQIMIPEEKVLEIYRKKGEEEQLKKIIEDDTYQEQWEADAFSGFTVVQEAGSNTPVLVTKQYLSGYFGHADCLGYAVAYLRLQPDNHWEVEYDFLQDE